MKFSHFSDVHIGGWREPELKELGIKSFELGIKKSIEENVAFVIIAGDLFDTSLPSIDLIKGVASILKKLKDHDISCYVIPGSHDFSPSGKTMLDVLERAGLVENVMKLKDNKLEFTEDKTGVKLTGFYGRKGGLEISEYRTVDFSNLENEKSFKIFLFHTLFSELKPKEFEMMSTESISLLPKYFDYYAGGHPHFVFNKEIENYGVVAYPGPTFPNNFKELEELGCGGFFIVEVKDNKVVTKHHKLSLKEVKSYLLNAENKTPLELEDTIINSVKNFNDKILTFRIEGCLKDGEPSDIDFNKIFSTFKDAYYILKNTSKLTSKDVKELNYKGENVNDVENEIINELLENKEFDIDFVKTLINNLDKEKNEGEKISDFEDRVIKDVKELLKIDN